MDAAAGAGVGLELAPTGWLEVSIYLYFERNKCFFG